MAFCNRVIYEIGPLIVSDPVVANHTFFLLHTNPDLPVDLKAYPNYTFLHEHYLSEFLKLIDYPFILIKEDRLYLLKQIYDVLSILLIIERKVGSQFKVLPCSETWILLTILQNPKLFLERVKKVFEDELGV